MILNANLPLLPSCWVSLTLDVEYLLRVTPACRCHSLNQIPNDYTGEVRNRFKGLDLIDRVPDELWMEVWFLYKVVSLFSGSNLIIYDAIP